MPIGAIWQAGLETPLLNFMLILSSLTFNQYGIAIIIFTIISRVLLFPLTLKTLRSAKAMQGLQPQMKEIQKKHSDPKRRSEETMKLYKESGVSPLGCLGPQLIQLPIFIALYQVIRITLGSTPESLVDLAPRVYSYQILENVIPLSTTFLWLDLGARGGFVLAIIVGASMWLQQKISTSSNPATQTPQQQSMNQMMQWMLPMMFGWFVLTLPAGLGVYWGFSTIIGIMLQWKYVGPGDFTWGSLIPAPMRKVREPSADRQKDENTQNTVEMTETNEMESTNGSGGDQRTNRRRRRRSGARTTRTSKRSSRRRSNS